MVMNGWKEKIHCFFKVFQMVLNAVHAQYEVHPVSGAKCIPYYTVKYLRQDGRKTKRRYLSYLIFMTVIILLTVLSSQWKKKSSW